MTGCNMRGILASLVVVTLTFLSPLYGWSQPNVYPSAAAVQPLDVGARAPGGTLKTAAGESLELAAAMQDRPSVLVFYRGSW